MHILGIDPGAKTGWCVYDTINRQVLEAGTIETHIVTEEVRLAWKQWQVDRVVMERLVPHGATYPQVVDAAYTSGRLVELVPHLGVCATLPIEITRRAVRKTLQTETNGSVRVQNDKTVKEALKLLHDDPNCDRKGGCLYALRGTGSDGWAALAAAYAWHALQQEVEATLRSGD